MNKINELSLKNLLYEIDTDVVTNTKGYTAQTAKLRMPDTNFESVHRFIEKNCRTALKMYDEGKIFYRGDKNNAKDYFVIDPSAAPRISRSKDNYYNLYMDTSPHWKGFPRRSFSVFFTGAKYAAASYSKEEPYIILPIGNPKVVVSYYNDFLLDIFKFYDEPLSVSDFSDYLSEIFNKDYRWQLATGLEPHTTNVSEFKLHVVKFIEILNGYKSGKYQIHDKTPDIVKKLLENNKIITESTFYDIMTPKKTKTRLLNFSDADLDSEIWTEGKCLLVKQELMDEGW